MSRGTPRRRPLANQSDGWSWRLTALVALVVVAASALILSRPPEAALAIAFDHDGRDDSSHIATPLPGAFGASGEVRLQLRLPGEQFDLPLELGDGTPRLGYEWLRVEDSVSVAPAQQLLGATAVAPDRPGFYRAALRRADGRRVIDSVVVGVMIPFSSKLRSTLNGYRIGTYRGEHETDGSSPLPRGFVEVRPANAELAVSTHFRLADFLTHDGQERWPRYLALDPRILDKVELVLRYLGAREHDVSVDVHSGFRTPLHNRRVPRAAGDSRHQYGDAADLAFDVDGDGRVTYLDCLAVARAVELVERDHPDLIGGLGLYGNRGTLPYVHIDVRGEKKRWRG